MKKILFIFAAMLLGSVGLHAENTITYTATEKLPGYNGSLDVGATAFGPAIISHTFSNGTGTITCDGEITKIEELAFQYCFGLTSIAIPSSVTTLGYSAFYHCTGLQTIMIPNTITMIGNNTFDGCSSLTSVTIPNSVKTISFAAFNKCYSLNSIDIPSSVTTIDFLAFSNCTALTSVTVNWTDVQSIVSIASDVFDGIANGAGPSGATLHVPEGTHNLYKQANGWKGFGSIMDPNNCKITYTATEKLSGYNGNLNIGATTFGSAIVNHDFSNGKGTITCNGDITKIGIGNNSYTSDDIRSLTSINIPNSVTSIIGDAFQHCARLTSIDIPNSVTSIGNRAFWGCGLETMYCYAPTPPLLLGASVFYHTSQDMSVYVYDTAAYKSQWAQLPASCFKPISAVVGDFKYEFFGGNKARIIAKEGDYTGNIIIPEQVSYMDYTFTVTEIGQSAFKNCTGLTSVTIPFTVTEIGQSAFEGCNNLTSDTIPVSVKEIGAWAFKNCTKLSNLQFADRKDPINIGIYAFENMALEKVIIPDWMTDIPEGLFFNNTKLKVIYLHELIDSIGYRPFGACPFEYIISMSQTPPTLADGAFEGHDKDANVIVYVPTSDAALAYKNSKWGDYFANCISNITYKITTPTTVEVVHAIPANGAVNLLPVVTLQGTNYTVVGIGNEALKGDTSLRSISLPATIQYIGNEAFSGCTKLKQTNSRAWEDLQTIGASAFYGCSALDSIYIPDAVQTIGKSAFMECKNLTSISLPTGLKNIPDECFHKCPLGTEIIVPEGVETIGKYAFEGTEEARLKAKSIALPSTLKEINFAAFYLHDGLKTITCRALIPPTLTEQAFASKEFQAQQITVYVPNRDVVTAYRRSNWGDSIRYNFKFSDLMAEENKAYLYEVAGDNKEAKAIADAYCDSINRATTTQQVQYYINTALTKIDKYTLNDYKIKLANYLDSVAGENLDAQRIAEEYRKKILLAIFRQEAEKIFAEGLAKINAVFELIDFKKACCDNLRNSAQNLGKEIIEIAEEYCILINQATTKEEANRIYLDGSQEISMYMQLSRYWEEPSNPGECRTTYGYPK